MELRSLNSDDRPALDALLMREPAHNVFHLSALAEQGIAPTAVAYGQPGAWGTGVFRGDELVGALMALRGTGGIFHTPGDDEVVEALAEVVLARVSSGVLSLLSLHGSQATPLLPLIKGAMVGRPDECDFTVLAPPDLQMPASPTGNGFGPARLATAADMEKLIDFYLHSFYTLARLPSREAWRTRLTEQLAFRTLFLVEDSQGRVASAALSSAEGGGAAMLGGVATLDEYRGNGLSPLCVAALCDYLFQHGTETVALFYLKDNNPAARVYEKLGFRHAGDWYLAPMGLLW